VGLGGVEQCRLLGVKRKHRLNLRLTAFDPTATLAVHCRNDLIVDLAPIKELVWTVHAELIEVDARKLRFKVEAHDEDKKVGDGTHRRAIIAIQRQG
jgi:fluoroacetyl-CoA-specific thioesterase